MVRRAHGGKGGLREIAGRRNQGLGTGGAMYRVQCHGAWKIDRNFDHIERIDPQFRRIANQGRPGRSEEHTSELQSLMRLTYAVFCLKKKMNIHTILHHMTIEISSSHQQTSILQQAINIPTLSS